MTKAKNLIAKVFTRLTVIERAPNHFGRTDAYWLCECECGNKVSVRSGALRSGKTKSCGCLQRDWVRNNKPAQTHGFAGEGKKRDPIYNIWNLIVQRCNNPNIRGYRDYGGRGIIVCERWLKFENFLADMGQRPSPKYSIGRIDNDGPYNKENCRWETKLQQANNTRTNHFIEFNGKRLTQSQWDRELGFPSGTVKNRIGRLKWPIIKALTTFKVENSKRKLTIDNETLPMAEWSRRYGIPVNVISARICKLKWPEEKAVKEPLKRKHLESHG